MQNVEQRGKRWKCCAVCTSFHDGDDDGDDGDDDGDGGDDGGGDDDGV